MTQNTDTPVSGKESDSDAMSLWYKGTIHEGVGDLDGAMNYYDRAIEADPDCIRYQISRGYLLWKCGRYEEALAVYNKFIGNSEHEDLGNLGDTGNSLEGMLYQLRGDVYFKLEKYTEALADYEMSAMINPEDDWNKEMIEEIRRVIG